MFGWSIRASACRSWLEAGEHPLGVEAGADDLDGDAALHRLGLVGDPDLAHAPFAELLAQLEAAGEDAFGQERRPVLPRGVGRAGVGAALEDAAGLLVGLEQALDAPAEGVVAAASPVQECAPLGPGGLARARRRRSIRHSSHQLLPEDGSGIHRARVQPPATPAAAWRPRRGSFGHARRRSGGGRRKQTERLST